MIVEINVVSVELAFPTLHETTPLVETKVFVQIDLFPKMSSLSTVNVTTFVPPSSETKEKEITFVALL